MPTPQSLLDECNCSPLRRASRKIGQLYDHHLAAVGLTNGQYSLLAELARRKGTGTSINVLADALDLDRTSLNHAMQPLVRDGLVVLRPDPSDRRARLVELTAEGVVSFEAGRVEWRKAQTAFMDRFDSADAQNLKDLLKVVMDIDFEEVDHGRRH